MEKKGLYNISSEETYLSGQIIFKEGSLSNTLYMVISGSVELSKNVQSQKFVIEKLNPGDLFGETALVGDVKRAFSATAVKKTTVGIIDMKELQKEYDQLSKQFKSIVETMPVRLKKILDRACDITD